MALGSEHHLLVGCWDVWVILGGRGTIAGVVWPFDFDGGLVTFGMGLFDIPWLSWWSIIVGLMFWFSRSLALPCYLIYYV